jgi:hypothetical protein
VEMFLMELPRRGIWRRVARYQVPCHASGQQARLSARRSGNRCGSGGQVRQSVSRSGQASVKVRCQVSRVRPASGVRSNRSTGGQVPRRQVEQVVRSGGIIQCVR